ncbi:hypothetical protein GALMADRAFT_516288 [Galerina marginata CBS 339.88]|uniref:Cytochrome b561 domain-containing protein n=1 Tax=Galerina marginata (strain CBS 339.88) TaxID=685588 RepID=A0A067SYM1_GALM3|nr:hypothetical protein GALMADRAFT_516288 [Galerina marginata CBS 339.88]
MHVKPPMEPVRRQQSVTGDTQCGTLMCIQATVNGSSTTYVLSSLGKQKLGWMAMGFGNQMSNTPMVIMWINSDSSVTLSQRSAPTEAMPTVVQNPPRIAVKSLDLSIISSNKPQLAFSVATNGDTKQPIIFAYGTTVPSSFEADATLIQHLDYGTLTLDLTKQLPSSTTGTSPTTSPTAGSSDSFSFPLLPYQKLIVAHAIFCTVGFLLLLPIGALLARYLRTIVAGPTWFKGHWGVQFAIAGPTILIGVVLGIQSVNEAKALHLDDDHKRWGITIFILYFVQCGLGAFIHFVKKQNRKRRPPQNYVHAVLGLAIIGLALYQVHSGYDHEWPSTTGRDPLPAGVKIIFWVWVVLLPVSYAIGLSFLPKQYRQERAKINDDDDDRNHLHLRETAYQSVGQRS